MDLVERKEAAPPLSVRRWSHPLAVGLAAFGFAFFGFLMWTLMTDPRWTHNQGVDRDIYHDATVRFLSGGSWFLPHQLTGQPYALAMGDVLYPPVAIPWMTATLLPWPLWYAVPLGIIAAVVIWHRPSPWGWAAIAACLMWPGSAELIGSGNPGMWIAAFAAIGTIWRPAFALVFLKPTTFAVLALLGMRSRGWWLLLALGAAVSLALLPLTLQWFGVVWYERGIPGITYAIRDLPLLLLPLIAWKTRTAGSPAGSATATWSLQPSGRGSA